MKKFENILALDQKALKNYLKNFLRSNQYKVIDDDGFLYAKGTVPVLLVAHMDRHPNHTQLVTEIEKLPFTDGTHWTSPQGICGDDRCGVWAIMNLIKNHRCSVLFTEDEELGCVGASKFCKTEFINDLGVNYIIQIDRRGSNDLVFYSNDNKEFQKWLEEKTGYKTAFGSCSDISKLMPASKIAGVNFSSGYYNEHTSQEYIVYEELENTIKVIDKLLDEEVEKPWEYVEKKYSYYGGYYGTRSSSLYGKGYGYSWYDDDDDDYYSHYYARVNGTQQTSKAKAKAPSDVTVELVVYLDETITGYDKLSVNGNTKPECWMNFFMTYSDICFEQVLDYDYR